MYNLMKSEWYKLRKDRSFRTIAVIIVALSIFWALFWYFDNRLDGDPPITGIESFMGTMAGNKLILQISLCILAGFFLSNEYTIGVVKNLASSGHSRKVIFTAKLMIYCCGTIMLGLLFPVSNVVLSTLLSGFGELDQGSAAALIIRSTILTMLYSAAFASIVALFAIILTDSGKTIAASMIFFLAISSGVFTIIGDYMPIIGSVYEYTVFKLVDDIGNLAPSNRELWKLTIVPIVTLVGCGLIGSWVYSKQEIK